MVDATRLVPTGNPKKLLLVEGPEDMEVFNCIFDHLHANRTVLVREGGGYERLRETVLPVAVKALKDSELAKLGVVVDADKNVTSRWTSLRDKLTNSCGYTALPKTLSLSGMIHTEPDLPTIGIWLMPDNSTPGALEQFARLLVPGSDKLWPEAETVVRHIKSIEQRFRITYEMKATLHTWLAWQKEPGKPIGQAMIKHFLDLKSPNASGLYNWLRTLFTL